MLMLQKNTQFLHTRTYSHSQEAHRTHPVCSFSITVWGFNGVFVHVRPFYVYVLLFYICIHAEKHVSKC